MDAHRVETAEAAGLRFRLATSATATVLGLVALALVALAVPLSILAHEGWTKGLNSVPLILGWGVMGFVVARKQPRHPMGWLLLAAAIFFMLNGDASNYSVAVYRVHHGSLPLGPVPVLLQPAWAPAIVLSAVALLLFPDGHLPTTRLRRLVWAFLVQRLVDRRFNRARYGAEAIVTAFTLRLRDAVDLDTVRGELLAAVDRAVEPAHASVWIRPPEARARG